MRYIVDTIVVARPKPRYTDFVHKTIPLRPTSHYERSLIADGHGSVCGVDEVGRGSWAGPLVAAAVVLPLNRPSVLRRLRDVHDSKLLSPQQRVQLNEIILSVCISAGIGWVSQQHIDRAGIAAANRLALQRAIESLSVPADAVLVDHFRLPDCAVPQLCISKGDRLSISIAAASIVAKVFRDRWMERCDARYPLYGFAQHKGYGTAVHRQALSIHGLCPLHRRSFEPVASLQA